jgi:hypothetical protein
MLIYEPTPPPWAFSGFEDVQRLADLVWSIRVMDPALWDRFIAACKELDMWISTGLVLAIWMEDTKSPEGLVPTGDPKPDAETYFVECRDALLDDLTRSKFEKRFFNWAVFHGALTKATEQLEIGDDPRQPW